MSDTDAVLNKVVLDAPISCLSDTGMNDQCIRVIALK